ncbi:MAG: TAXI family TRAP transporter solute-binding subunit [Syntrophomonadaceae bacterium]|jgi:TRAP transporter TAXI family solute receptor
MKRIGSRILVVFLVVSLIAAGLTGCSKSESPADQQPAAQTKFINIATGGTAGTYYPLGGAMAEILNQNIPGVNATAQSTGASAANINMLAEGSVDLGLVQNDVAYYALNGVELFKDKKVSGLQGISTLYPETCQIITLTKSGIKSVADFKGKKVAVGAAGSGVEANARQILLAHGLTYDDINPQYLSFAEAANGLKDGNIDAAFVTAGHPTAAIQDLAAQHEITLIPIADDTADKLVAEYPYYTKVTIPANTYPNQKEDTKTLAVQAMLITTDKMDEDTVYQITKAIYSNLDKLASTHSVGKLITIESAAEGMSIPVHPGAAKFFNEKK